MNRIDRIRHYQPRIENTVSKSNLESNDSESELAYEIVANPKFFQAVIIGTLPFTAIGWALLGFSASGAIAGAALGLWICLSLIPSVIMLPKEPNKGDKVTDTSLE